MEESSEISDCSSQEINQNSSQELLNTSDIVNENINKETLLINTSQVQNATDSHPLMYSPLSPISPDFPDLIPEKPKSKGNYDKHFQPNAHSTRVGNLSELDSFEKKVNEPILDYNEQPADFPDSPTALKLLMPSLFEFPDSAHETSDNENDKSVYEAHLSSNLQNVQLTMNEKEGNLNFLAHKKRSNKLRKIKVLPTSHSQDSDESSICSNTDSVKSEDIFADGDNSEDKVETDDNNTSEPIEPLSAADERRHARHWQRMVLPGGEQRTIDMRVIEPYKRVLSHGGYLRSGGNTAIVLFSACYLPDKSRVDYDYVMDNLFLYVLWTLERLVTEDYVLVYLHGGATRLPSFSWLKKCYQQVGRKLRKNLSHLYLVHPTLWIKTMLFMAKPFISSKFYRKISFMGTLRELMIRVPLESAAIPEKVKKYDSLHCAT